MSLKGKRIAVFVSGHGTNMVHIARYFEGTGVCVAIVITDNAACEAVERARELGIRTQAFTKEEIKFGDNVVALLQSERIDLIVLAGFLGQIGSGLLAAFPQRIVNLHPALLPKYGGKGMYGDHVHRAILSAGEAQSGITIHLVDEQYDHGTILCQARCKVLPDDTPERLAKRIHRLEYLYYPIVIEYLLKKQDEADEA